MKVNISSTAKERLDEVLANPKNSGTSLRVVFQGFG